MGDINSEAERIYKSLLKIDIVQAKKRENDANDYRFNSAQKCLKLRHDLKIYR